MLYEIEENEDVPVFKVILVMKELKSVVVLAISIPLITKASVPDIPYMPEHLELLVYYLLKY
jgi:hypothetical protein